jgi:hypothetical protein
MTNKKIKTLDFLPEIFQTDKNDKFLSGTLESLIQSPQLERIDGYIGSKISPNFKSTSDFYINEISPSRKNYQLEPAAIIQDQSGNIKNAVTFNDIVNEIAQLGVDTSNLDRLFRFDYYSYDPHIDWDKFVNYQEYFWLPVGPQTVTILNSSTTATNVTLSIIGQKSYQIPNSGPFLSTGMRIKFSGNIVPSSYLTSEYFVEGVGSSIELVDIKNLTVFGNEGSIGRDLFDSNNFDFYSFDSYKDIPIQPEFVTINRASRDKNPWSRYNRWVHSDIISKSAEINGTVPIFPLDSRAARPIIEFKSNLKLYNFGYAAHAAVDLIDDSVTNAMLDIQGSDGYHIDGVLLDKGNRVIFNADVDPNIRGKIFEVNFIELTGKILLVLDRPSDYTPNTNYSIVVSKGKQYAGTSWWYDGNIWQYSQQKTKINQAPLFDLFDDQGNSYSDLNLYSSDFRGNAIFSYEIGTGPTDKYLGFPLKHKNSSGTGSLLFKNCFNTDSFSISKSQVLTKINTSKTFCKFTKVTGDEFANVWSTASTYRLPILQLYTTDISTSTIEIIAIDSPTVNNFSVEVSLNAGRSSFTDYFTTSSNGKSLVQFKNILPADTDVVLKIKTDATSNSNGYYEIPPNLTNNPVNGLIPEISFTEINDHVWTIYQSVSNFSGSFPGKSNLRDLGLVNNYGTRLISNANSLAFCSIFIGKKEHNLFDAIEKSADQYNQFKSSFLKYLMLVDQSVAPSDAVDLILTEINSNKNSNSNYYSSDMLACSIDYTEKTWIVQSALVKSYSINSVFYPNKLTYRTILVYLNSTLLTFEVDYEFDTIDSRVSLLRSISAGDILTIRDYPDSRGSYVPPTPTKLGLYPKFIPKIFVDNTYKIDRMVIQGHDGSIMIAYNDYRDNIILEFEKRVYNNIKANYNSRLFDITSFLPGKFRSTLYSIDQINQILKNSFIKWTGSFKIDYRTNNSVDENSPFTYNYSVSNIGNSLEVKGSWRAIYKYYYDTDRPHTNPWEMLGFSAKPFWWDSQYGINYSSSNTALWNDLEQGLIRQGPTAGINRVYTRLGLSTVLPVDSLGKLRDPIAIGLARLSNDISRNWEFAEFSPTETTWRRSSYWPFVVQKLMAALVPSIYLSYMYDPIRIRKNLVNQWVYDDTSYFPTIQSAFIHGENDQQTSGFSVFVSEIGRQRDSNYISLLRSDLEYLSFNLFYRAGGFVSKDKLQISLDTASVGSSSNSAILPQENFSLILYTSTPIKSISMSGIVVEQHSDGFLIRGYDNLSPFFNVYSTVRNENTSLLTVGGTSEPYVIWTNGGDPGVDLGLSSADTTSASSAVVGKFYQAGQLVKYGDSFYRVTTSHQSGSSFNPSYFQIVKSVPIVGGISVQISPKFVKEITKISYGTILSTPQDVYDLIVGYGAWLTDQGFLFNEYNLDLKTTLNWEFSAKEFLYWTLQNWSLGSVIILSPFSNRIEFNSPYLIADNFFNNLYNNLVLDATGTQIPKVNLNITRTDNNLLVETSNFKLGIFFIKINSIQKEHALVFNNSTIYGDVIYSIETGYRQGRMKLSGFRTANWNGDYFSPGFIYDNLKISDWEQYRDYDPSDIVKFGNEYYSAINKIFGNNTFNFNEWSKLFSKPEKLLLSNFDYKIGQFEDFYSLDIDNFDVAQQKMAQHLIGYTPRTYLNSIFSNPISQYKFYQGFIKEKGTKNAIDKLNKVGIFGQQGEIVYQEEWAFRVGSYGSFRTFNELETTLIEGSFIDNPQIISFVDKIPDANKLISYSTSGNWIVTPTDYTPSSSFPTTSFPYSQIDFKLETAGYVDIGDVSFTAFNESSLLDIADNSIINEGDTFWLGFSSSKDWDVLRYTQLSSIITNILISEDASSLIITTSLDHNLSEGDIISIIQSDTAINSIYKVASVLDNLQFLVNKAPNVQQLTITDYGIIFKFVSFKFETFDEILNDYDLVSLPVGTKFWINNNNSGKWVVYQKSNNYSYVFKETYPVPILHTGLGKRLYKNKNSNRIFSGAPQYQNGNTYGRVYVYTTILSDLFSNFSYALNDPFNIYTSSTTTLTDFGNSIGYDPLQSLIYVGAPSVGSMKVNTTGSGVLRFTTGTESIYSGLIQEGAVKISALDSLLGEIPKLVLLSPYSKNYERFGESVFLQQNKLLVGAPGTLTTSTGVVYLFTVTTTSTAALPNIKYINLLTTSTLLPGSQFGYSISGIAESGPIAIGAPGYNLETGKVYIFTGSAGTTTQFSQTIDSPFPINSRFGEKVFITNNGNYLMVSAPMLLNTDNSYGRVAIYSATNNGFILDQIIPNPKPGSNLHFGNDIGANSSGTILAISATGKITDVRTVFDDVNQLLDTTTFDSVSTIFYDAVLDSGTVYIYNRKLRRFVLSSEILPPVKESSTNYGSSIVVEDESIYIGAPALDLTTAVHPQIFQFTKKDKSFDSWEILYQQPDLVAVDTIQKISLIDSEKGNVIEYLDVIDPLKGKIAGIAEQELHYKSAVDPAVYSIGESGNIIDPTTNWLDEHVGELWWDLGSIKYQWYEQGDLVKRKNKWGKLFPGCSIDIYEWVETQYLPSEWSALADTTAGIIQGISGQPKFIDDTVISVRQSYDSVSNTTSYIYYYWVKNKSIIPNAKNRRISASEVSSIIADPATYGLKFAAILSSNSIALSNLGGYLINDRISLNVSFDTINNPILKHTEWILLQEGFANSPPPKLLEKKLVDSLIGLDELGNLVPDPNLNGRSKYGVEIRPRQTFFKNRLSALREVITFTNKILLSNRITGSRDFTNLNQEEKISDLTTNEYDLVIEDATYLELIDLFNIRTPELQCRVVNGKIVNVSISASGEGYKTNPIIKIISDAGSGAIIKTNINDLGQIVSTEILSPGQGYSDNDPPTLSIRPFTVLVLSDIFGKWSKFIYSIQEKKWIRSHTQKYNTKLYWKYVDWVSSSFNRQIKYSNIVNYVGDIISSNLLLGQYVKVNNDGLGNYLVLEKTESGIWGSFSENFDIVYAENGTIQILDEIWNLDISKYNWDKNLSYDDGLYSQTPDIELRYILLALKHDIFIGELKVYWNLFFFNAVKFALTEQKQLDWAFKTSFINVENTIGELSQQYTYNLISNTAQEDYLKEIKPFHTQIRKFTNNYTKLEISKTEIIDTCRPSVMLKFDRVSNFNQLGDDSVVDRFVLSLYQSTVLLNWVAQPDKSKIRVTLNGFLFLGYQYRLEYFTRKYNGYDKKFSRIVLLENIPDTTGQVLQVEYQKHIDLKTAAERILSYHKTNESIDQIIEGFVYPKTKIETLPLTQSVNWDVNNIGFGDFRWNDNVDTYSATYLTSATIAYESELTVNSTVGIKKGDYVNVTSATTLSFSTSSVFVASVNSLTSTIQLDIPPIVTLSTGTSIEFWSYKPYDTSLDSIIDGDKLSTYSTDILLDGDNFYTPNTSFAPEEFIPGQASDTIGINVFTKYGKSSPIIATGGLYVTNNRLTTTVKISLLTIPTVYDEISVLFNNKFLPKSSITIAADSDNKVCIFTELSTSSFGLISYTVINIGGGSISNNGIIDKSVLFQTLTVNDPVMVLESLSDYRSVSSVYVSLDGVQVPLVGTVPSGDLSYSLTYSSSGTNYRSAVKFNNITLGEHLGQAWFFGSSFEEFSILQNQLVPITSLTQTSIPLTNLLSGVNENQLSLVIVEQTSNGILKRLQPPSIAYYTVSNSNLTFSINKTTARSSGTYTLSNNLIRVYVDNKKLVPGPDFLINLTNNSITISPFAAKNGSEVAIVDLLSTWDYDVDSNIVKLSSPVVPSTLNILTFLSGNQLAMSLESFDGNSTNRFKLYKSVKNARYIWVSINGVPLAAEIDFNILEDRSTVQISDNFRINPWDKILIQIISDQSEIVSVLGYRIFNDIINNTSFKRISKSNTTRLAAPLTYLDTEIFLDDASVLSVPNPDDNLSGLVMINGELIQYQKIDRNVLKGLKRGVFGTSPSVYSDVSTKVIDQGWKQTIPFVETVLKQKIKTVSGSNVYTILTTSTTATNDGIVLSLSSATSLVDQIQVVYGGRLLRKSELLYHDTTVSYDSPIANIKGKRSSTNDFININNVNPATLNDAYIVTSTNQIWIYTGSSETDSIKGYVYRGLNYSPPEFSIVAKINTTTAAIYANTATMMSVGTIAPNLSYDLDGDGAVTLNDALGYLKLSLIKSSDSIQDILNFTVNPQSNYQNLISQQIILNIEGGVSNNIDLIVMKKQFNSKTLWNNGVSLFQSQTDSAKFLQDKPSELPDITYYGGYKGLSLDTGFYLSTGTNFNLLVGP